jgi:DNA-binding XRE family transcriptional regulator
MTIFVAPIIQEMNVALNVRHYREMRGMTQAQLTKLMIERGHKFHDIAIHRIEMLKRDVSVIEAINLAQILNVDILDLTGWAYDEDNDGAGN